MKTHAHTEASGEIIARIAIITCSDTRTGETDTSGAFISTSAANAGHQIVSHVIVRDDPSLILLSLEDAIHQSAQIILINGGTGISKRDNTFDALSAVFDTTIPGFGELFRSLSFEEIGSASMLSRAQAGRYGSSIIFSMPGSTGAVRLAMSQLILPQIGHLISEMEK